MQITHIIESTATGTLSIVSMLANEQSLNNSVTVIYSRRPETPLNLEDYFSTNVNLIECQLESKKLFKSVFKLNRKLRSLCPDIIHCHSSFAGFIGRLAAIRNKAKVFYSPHCISFMRKDISLLKATVFKFLEIIGTFKKSTYIACSESERLAIRKALPYVNVVLIENAVNLSEFDLNSKKSFEKSHLEKLKVISVGGIRPQKGPSEFAKISKYFNNHNVEFIWVGDGDIELKKMLLSAGVQVKGWLDKKSVLSQLHQADVYLSTALWEGMPVSIIEASAADLPVIARNCEGNKDVVENGTSGILFDNTDEAVEKLLCLIKSEQLRESLAVKAKEAVFNRFSVDRYIKEVTKIYEE